MNSPSSPTAEANSAKLYEALSQSPGSERSWGSRAEPTRLQKILHPFTFDEGDDIMRERWVNGPLTMTVTCIVPETVCSVLDMHFVSLRIVDGEAGLSSNEIITDPEELKHTLRIVESTRQESQAA